MAAESNATAVPGPGALGETPAKCPRCGGAFVLLSTPQGVDVDRCAGCQAIWLDKGEINFFTEEWEYLRDYALSRAQATELVCPSCGRRLEEGMWTSADIRVDKCPGCGGLFLEAGELAAVGRLHPGIEYVLAEERKVDWFGYPRIYILGAAALVLALALATFAAGLFGAGGASAGALALAGLALLVIAACRFTGNELGDVSIRALRGLHFPMSTVPQRASVSGHLRTSADEIRLVDPTGSLPIWSRRGFAPLAAIDERWVTKVRALPTDQAVRVQGWWRAWPFQSFSVVRIHPHGSGPGAEIRALTSLAHLWALAGGGGLLLFLGVLLPVARHEAFVRFSQAREQIALDADSWLQLGLAEAYREKYALAKEHLQRAIDADQEGIADDRAVSEAHYNLGVIALLELKKDPARKELEAALTKDPRNGHARRALELIDAREPFGLPGTDGRVFDAK